jgi:hypothetical protein
MFLATRSSVYELAIIAASVILAKIVILAEIVVFFDAATAGR